MITDDYDNLSKKEFCHITKKLYPNELMIRFVLSSSNVLTLDLYNEFEGDEFYVLASKKELEKVCRHFSKKYEIVFQPADLVPRIDSILLKRIVGLISLARKAGKVIIGYEKLQRCLSVNKIVLLLQAKDGSEIRKRDLMLPKPQKARIDCLNKGELGASFGKNAITAVGFLKSSFTNPLIFDTSRLESLRRC